MQMEDKEARGVDISFRRLSELIRLAFFEVTGPSREGLHMGITWTQPRSPE